MVAVVLLNPLPLPLLLPPEPSPEMLAYDAARDVCVCAACVAPPQPCPREMAEGAARYARHAEASAAVLARIRGMPPY